MQFWQRVGAFSQGVGPEDAHADVHGAVRLLRVLGWMVAAAAAVSILNALIITPISMITSGTGMLTDGGPFFVLTTIFGLFWTVAFTLGVLFWIGWTLEQWSTGHRGGHTSAFVMSITGTVWFGLGTLVSIIGMVALVYAMTQTAVGGITVTGSWIGIPLIIAQLVVSILLLVAVQRPEVKNHFEPAAA